MNNHIILISLLKGLQRLFALLMSWYCELLTSLVLLSLLPWPTLIWTSRHRCHHGSAQKQKDTVLITIFKSHVCVWNKVSWKILSQTLSSHPHLQKISRFLIHWIWIEVFSKRSNSDKGRIQVGGGRGLISYWCSGNIFFQLMGPKGRQKREELDDKRGLDTHSLWHRILALLVLSHFEWKVWKVLEITRGSRSRRDLCHVPLSGILRGGRILKFQLILWSEYNLKPEQDKVNMRKWNDRLISLINIDFFKSHQK